ncbi:unnamed protein product [Rotaria socialis]|uniref:Uncharacterized protein n=1 Tax=Rotaria socialis TaxID=392032 RepID=A0A817UK52_9BILA|nr:unnamed protein product [Rotaria socialis]
MPREERYRCFWCKGQINPDDSVCGTCRRRYDRWRKAMQIDFDHLDVPVNKTDPQENEEPIFRDTVNTRNRLGLQVAMHGFLYNEKQLPADEANRT